jgi:Ca2+-binding RTX toxin-like protein
LTDSTPGTPAAIGDTFTVTLGTVDDNDGLPPLSQFNIIWQVEETPGAGDWVNIAHPVTDALFTGLTFTPTPDLELEGLSIRAVGSFTGNNGIPEVVMSAPTVALAAATVTAATEGDDEIFGTVGADMIDGLGGDDTIFGFAGNDIITGGAGSDLIDGGEGSDTAVFAGLIEDFTFELTPDNTIEVVHNVTGEEDEVISIESFQFDNGTLTLAQVELLAGVIPAATAGDDVLNGGVLDDIIDGLAGNDTINGGDGNDTLTGGLGNDTINGDAGNDTIDGGDGNDVLNGGAGLDTILGGAGIDNIDGGGGADIIDGGTQADVILGGGGADIIDGGGGADEIFGGGGADTINGGGGADQISGENGADILSGNGGNDFIDGGAGTDTINGGNGDDILIGGGGIDTFVFSGNNFGADTILDFDDVGGGQDFIDLTFFGLGFDDLTIEDNTLGGTVITVGTAGTITLQGLTPDSLDESDFNFA